MKPGPRNLITDVGGLTVGHAEHEAAKTGTTVVLTDQPTTASVAILGGAPGTRDTACLEPHQTVDKINAIVLSGGSAFGLDACGGVQKWLLEHNVGFQIGQTRVPIVPGAILFDLLNNGGKVWETEPLYRELGYHACDNATADFKLGTCGAGKGATTANLKGGLGSASTMLDNGIVVGALVAVNPMGSVTLGNSKHFWAAPFEIGNEFGGLGYPQNFGKEFSRVQVKTAPSEPGGNTTIGVLATNAKLSKSDCKQLAIMAHDGLTRAIWPAHLPMDGDLLFALATDDVPIENKITGMMELGIAAATTLSRAIARGVYLAVAEENDPLPVWSDLQ